MKKLIFITLTISILISCNNEKSFSDKVIEDIRNGTISYRQTGGQPLLHDGKSRLSSVINEHLKAESWELMEVEELIFLPKNLFHIPQDISSIEYVSEWSSSFDLMKIEKYNLNYYENDEILQKIYVTYEDFKQSIITNPQEYENFEVNEELEYVRYSKNIEEKRYKYRITTIHGTEIITTCLYLINKDWVVGAIFRNEN